MCRSNQGVFCQPTAEYDQGLWRYRLRSPVEMPKSRSITFGPARLRIGLGHWRLSMIRRDGTPLLEYANRRSRTRDKDSSVLRPHQQGRLGTSRPQLHNSFFVMLVKKQKGDQGPRERDHCRVLLASVLILRKLRLSSRCRTSRTSQGPCLPSGTQRPKPHHQRVSRAYRVHGSWRSVIS